MAEYEIRLRPRQILNVVEGVRFGNRPPIDPGATEIVSAEIRDDGFVYFTVRTGEEDIDAEFRQQFGG